MADDYFDRSLAWGPDQGPVPGAVAAVYAITDTEFSTPLDITDLTDVPLPSLVADEFGVYPPFKIVTGEKDVIVKSGDLLTPLTSRRGLQGDPGEPGPPGAGLHLLGELDAEEDLPETGTVGDAYVIDGDLWAWVDTAWANIGQFQGDGVQMRVDDGVVQWKRDSDAGWTDLYTPEGGGASSFADLDGVPSDNTALANALNAKASNTALALKADAADVSAALDLKAPLASPAFTGNPTVPTQATSNNSTRAASTAFVHSAVAADTPAIALSTIGAKFVFADSYAALPTTGEAGTLYVVPRSS